MSQSTGPVAAAVGVVIGNAVLLQGMPLATQLRPIVGGAIAAAGLSFIETFAPGVAVGLSYLILVSVLFVRPAPNVHAPLESLANWYANVKPPN